MSENCVVHSFANSVPPINYSVLAKTARVHSVLRMIRKSKKDKEPKNNCSSILLLTIVLHKGSFSYYISVFLNLNEVTLEQTCSTCSIVSYIITRVKLNGQLFAQILLNERNYS